MTTVCRLPTEGDHPIAWTLFAVTTAAIWGFTFAVGERRGLGLDVPWGLLLGGVAAVVALVTYSIWVRGVPRRLSLRVDPEGIGLLQGRTERWTISWDGDVGRDRERRRGRARQPPRRLVPPARPGRGQSPRRSGADPPRRFLVGAAVGVRHGGPPPPRPGPPHPGRARRATLDAVPFALAMHRHPPGRDVR